MKNLGVGFSTSTSKGMPTKEATPSVRASSARSAGGRKAAPVATPKAAAQAPKSSSPTAGAKKSVKKKVAKKKKVSAADGVEAQADAETDATADEGYDTEADALDAAETPQGSPEGLPTAPPSGPVARQKPALPKLVMDKIPEPLVSDRAPLAGSDRSADEEDTKLTRDEWVLEQMRLSAAMANIGAMNDDYELDPDDDRFAPPDDDGEEDRFAPPEVSTYPYEESAHSARSESRRLNARSNQQLLSFRAHGTARDRTLSQR
jgi:hypothetical protein